MSLEFHALRRGEVLPPITFHVTAEQVRMSRSEYRKAGGICPLDARGMLRELERSNHPPQPFAFVVGDQLCVPQWL